MPSFVQRLYDAATRHHSWLCVGLDPDPGRTPPDHIFQFCARIVDATSDLVCAYKPNLAFFEAAGVDGIVALTKLRDLVPAHIPIIGDAKRGDIGSTAQAYAWALFETFRFDAGTVNPYLGRDALAPFVEYGDRGVFVLVKTSNPGSGDLQDLATEPGGRPLYERVAMLAMELNQRGNIGLVVGGTYPEELAAIRAICPSAPFLIPGVGAQGGDLEASVRFGTDAKGQGAIISSSRSIIYASNGPGAADAVRAAALRSREAINAAIAGIKAGR